MASSVRRLQPWMGARWPRTPEDKGPAVVVQATVRVNRIRGKRMEDAAMLLVDNGEMTDLMLMVKDNTAALPRLVEAGAMVMNNGRTAAMVAGGSMVTGPRYFRRRGHGA